MHLDVGVLVGIRVRRAGASYSAHGETPTPVLIVHRQKREIKKWYAPGLRSYRGWRMSSIPIVALGSFLEGVVDYGTSSGGRGPG